MKKSLLNLAGAAILALALSTAVKATPINGSIDIGALGSTAAVTFSDIPADPFGTVSFTPTSSNALVTNAVGSYAGLLGTIGTYSSFNYSLGAIPAEVIWTINPTTYFVLDNMSVVTVTGDVGLSLWGSGTAYLTGFDPTPGSWTFSASTNTPGATFNFSSTTNVPDGGTTSLLVALGLVAMSLVAYRRKGA